MEEKWLTTKEVAQMLKVHENTVLRYAQAGYHGVRLANVRVGKCRRYTLEAVQEFLRACNPDNHMVTIGVQALNIHFCPKKIGGK